MSDHRGTREQTSDPPGGPAQNEIAFCVLFAVTLSVAAVAVAFEHVARVQVARGMYAILAGLMVIGGTGWTIAWSVARAEERVRRRVEDEMAELREEVARAGHRMAELTIQVEALTRAVAQSRPSSGPSAHRYVSGSAAVAAQGDTVPLNQAVDPAAADALRRLNVRLLQGGNDR